MIQRLTELLQNPLKLDGSAQGDRGFSLIEVMLAIAILATMAMLTVGAITSGFRLRERTVDSFETRRIMRQAVDRMCRELSMAFVVHPEATELMEQFSENNDRRYETIFEGSDREVTFTTMGHVARYDDEATSGQAEISYRIESQRGRDGRLHDNLVRRVDAPIDGEPETGGLVGTVIRDIESIEIEYWDGEREIAGDAWERSWDGMNEEPPRLPERVRITVEVPHPYNDRNTMVYSQVTSITMNMPLKILPTDIVEELVDQEQAIEEATGQEVDLVEEALDE